MKYSDKKEYTVWWTSEDGQGDMEGESFDTYEEAEASITAFKKLLLEQCGSQEEIESIKSGSFNIQGSHP
jgi:hypothetical protein